jgi:hypothetical protein
MEELLQQIQQQMQQQSQDMQQIQQQSNKFQQQMQANGSIPAIRAAYDANRKKYIFRIFMLH